MFFFPNQTGIGLENRTQFLGVTFPNQTGFGLEKDTEWNLATVQLAIISKGQLIQLAVLCICTQWDAIGGEQKLTLAQFAPTTVQLHFFCDVWCTLLV